MSTCTCVVESTRQVWHEVTLSYRLCITGYLERHAHDPRRHETDEGALEFADGNVRIGCSLLDGSLW